MIRGATDVSGGFRMRTQVCVIGSGAGGGVAAGLLAEAGREVVVLEEGEHVPASRMNQREGDMYPLLYRDGANQMTDDGGINVLQGRTLGGSTVINMADVVDIPDPVLEHWAVHYGVDRYSKQAVHEAARMARAAIGANRIAPDRVNRNNQLLLDAGRKLGLAGEVMDHNRVGCIGSGYCLIGCAYDAKRSVALTWIPRALASGRCLVQTGARVEQLEWSGSRVTAVVGSVIEGKSGRVLAPFRVEAERFVLAAGAIHSPLLLLASKLGGDQVGRNLSLQPQAPMAALFEEELVMYRGIPQSVALNGLEEQTAERGLSGFRIEGVSGGPAMSAVASTLPAKQLHSLMKNYRKTAGVLVLVPDRPVGRVFRSRDGRPKIVYRLTEDYAATLRRGIRTAAEVYLAAGARSVMLPVQGLEPVADRQGLSQIDGMRFLSSTCPFISAHPQGTCRMGRDPRSSVVGLDLKLHGLANLHVLDASVFPSSASSHTMIPVMSFAALGVGELI